jgi:uncharacterized membrane protein
MTLVSPRFVIRAVLAAVMLCPLPARSQPPPAPAEQKGFQLCNRTSEAVDVAKALNVTSSADHEKGRGLAITSEGWFPLQPGDCSYLWTGALRFRYYLVYAEGQTTRRRWSGNVPACVARGKFVLTLEACQGAGDRRDFVEVDTGDGDSFTYDLR